MVELINENKLGVVKDTPVEEAVEANFKGETTEVGLYLAMARQAQREGYPEVAEILRSIALDEAWHAARFAELGGKISESTKENVEKMLKGEIGANKGKREAAVKAKEAGVAEAHDFFDESSRDEARHARALEGLLKRYFEK
ncbi:MAG: rubrerythrin family protein [Armatimonadetes bacterium CG07_land_8_20_14_0_80_40_9]|nr:MAG: rubrerythrin family protein [Armatimonadetes bacterium CG07_land_8_20_14_0_80_40_9]